MYQPVKLEISTTDEKLVTLCKCYWKLQAVAHPPYFQFSYPVKDLAKLYDFTQAKQITHIVSPLCKAYTHCSVCGKTLKLAMRQDYYDLYDYEGMREDDTLKDAWCPECRNQSSSPMRFVKSFGWSLHQYNYYQALKRDYAVVATKVALSDIVGVEGIRNLLSGTPYWNQRGYEQLRFSFVLYDTPSTARFILKPFIAIDFSEDVFPLEDHKTSFKRAVLSAIGIPYYRLPYDQAKLFSEDTMQALMEVQAPHSIESQPSMNLNQQEDEEEKTRLIKGSKANPSPHEDPSPS